MDGFSRTRISPRGQEIDSLEGEKEIIEDLLIESTFELAEVGTVNAVLSADRIAWVNHGESRESSRWAAAPGLRQSLRGCCYPCSQRHKFLARWTPPQEAHTIVLLSEVYGVENLERSENTSEHDPEHAFVVYTFRRKTDSSGTWIPCEFVFQHASADICQYWVRQIRSLLEADPSRAHKLLVLVNPYGGRRQGVETWNSVEPIFERANIELQVIVTERPGHAFDIMDGTPDADLDAHDGIVVVGGDGMFNEVLNGLAMRRHRAPPTPDPVARSRARSSSNASPVATQGEAAGMGTWQVAASPELLHESGPESALSRQSDAIGNPSLSAGRVGGGNPPSEVDGSSLHEHQRPFASKAPTLLSGDMDMPTDVVGHSSEQFGGVERQRWLDESHNQEWASADASKDEEIMEAHVHSPHKRTALTQKHFSRGLPFLRTSKSMQTTAHERLRNSSDTENVDESIDLDHSAAALAPAVPGVVPDAMPASEASSSSEAQLSSATGASMPGQPGFDLVPDHGLSVCKRKMRIGIIPAGSTDTIVISTTGSRDPVTAALHIVLGDRMPLDVVRITSWKSRGRPTSSSRTRRPWSKKSALAGDNLGDNLHPENGAAQASPKVRYAASFAGYGFYGEVARESEQYRWMGPARYDFAGFVTYLRHKLFDAEVSYLELPHSPSRDSSHPHGPWPGGAGGSSVGTSSLHRRHASGKAICRVGCATCAGGIDLSHLANLSSDDEGMPVGSRAEKRQGPRWKTIRSNFHSVGAAVMSCRNDKAPEGVAAHAHLADGYLHLILIKECSRAQYLQQLLRLTWKGADPLDFDFVEHHKTPAFTFVSHGRESIWNVDGELFPAHQLSAQVFRGLVDVFARGPEY